LADHKFEKDTTNWVFVSGQTEPRHLFDIIHAVHTLKLKGVSEDRIFIFTDRPGAAIHLEEYGIKAKHNELREMEERMTALPSAANLVMCVTGHGLPNGIPVMRGISLEKTISPTQILKCARSCKDQKVGVLVLTQCYAGIFNFSDARTEPKVVLIGSAELDLSLSPSMQLKVPIPNINPKEPALAEWNANIFMLTLFKWLEAPSDIDGDGALTLLDAYKSAGANSHLFLRNLKTSLSLNLEEWLIEPSRSVRDARAKTGSITEAEQQELLAREQTIKQQADILYINPVPWILHADLARAIKILL